MFVPYPTASGPRGGNCPQQAGGGYRASLVAGLVMPQPSGPPGPAALLRLTAIRLRRSRGPGRWGYSPVAPPPPLAREMPARPPRCVSLNW